MAKRATRSTFHLFIVVLFSGLASAYTNSSKNALRLFKCGNGKSVQMAWTCDGDDDCGDNSDETHPDCIRHNCTSDEFKCAVNHRCISLSFKCDREEDCPDGSDELNCPDANKCPKDTVECGGRCVPLTWFCDGQLDCPNGDDEKQCDKSCATKPGEQPKWVCPSGKCIDLSWLCDGDADCDDGADEKNCKPQTCTENDFTCGDGSCQPLKFRCDNDRDCSDGSDEANCTIPFHKIVSTCSSSQFQCGTECIHKSWVCDGDVDCPGGEDEEATLCRKMCPKGMFRCKDGSCVSGTSHCDAMRDCHDGSDEVNCTVTVPACNSFEVDCGYGLCLPQEAACNGIRDCPDGRDEDSARCGIDECSQNNGGCDHICVNTKLGFTCKCRSGYRLVNETICEDIDECSKPGSCAQNCHNTLGSFECSCINGYIKDRVDPSRCLADPSSGVPSLLVTLRSYIYRVYLDGSHEVVVDDTSASTALDFHYAYGLVFWSDMEEKKIFSASLASKGSDRRAIAQVSTCDGLAVDWVHNHVYWTDAGLDHIRVANLDGSNQKTLIDTELDSPRAIVVDPKRGWMYWTDWGSPAKVERAALDGSNRLVLVSGGLLGWPNGLTLDAESGRIYWVDAKLHSIFSSNENGRSRRLVLKDANLLNLPHSVAQFEDRVFWTEWDKNVIYTGSKFDGSNVTKLTTDRLLHSPTVVQVFHKYRQPLLTNACQFASCSHLCLPSQKKEYVCACPDDMDLDHDMRTCTTNVVSRPSPPHKIPHPRPTNGPVLIDYPSSTMSPAPDPAIPQLTLDDFLSWAVIFVFILIGSSFCSLVLVGCCYWVYRCYVSGGLKMMNFDNPIYHKSPTQEPLCPPEQAQPLV